MAWATSRSNGAIPVVGSQRPTRRVWWTSQAAREASAPPRSYSCSTRMLRARPAGKLVCRRRRAWMEVFSSALMTYWPAPSGASKTTPFGGKLGVAGKDPRVVLPRLDRVLGQPAPQRRDRDLADQAAGQQLLAQLGKTPARQRDPAGCGQLTGDRLGVGDHRRWEDARAARPLAVSQAVEALPGEPLAPLAHGVGR